MAMEYFHLIARTRYGIVPFLERGACAELWQRLRLRMGPTLACVVMPNHVHLDLEGTDPERARLDFVTELVAFAQSRFPGSRIWDPLGPPELLPDRLHLKRHIRYVHLNPCRAGLALDPLEWEWSTHRDAVGAVADPWLDLRAMGRLWEGRTQDFSTRFHAYVSGDPTVKVAGTPLPSQNAGSPIVATLARIDEAVLRVTRSPDGRLKAHSSPLRRLGLLAAAELGHCRQTVLADWLGITPRTVRNLLADPVSAAEQDILKAVQWNLLNRDRLFPKSGNLKGTALSGVA